LDGLPQIAFDETLAEEAGARSDRTVSEKILNARGIGGTGLV
jgi:hypothetical protein